MDGIQKNWVTLIGLVIWPLTHMFLCKKINYKTYRNISELQFFPA